MLVFNFENYKPKKKLSIYFLKDYLIKHYLKINTGL